MKNIFKNSKRGIAAILTLCILICVAGTCVYAASIPEENTAHTEETAQELMPIMARGCSNYDYDGYTMNQLKVEKGWTLRMDGDVYHYIIYSGGTAIGKYHTGLNNGQDPHFHLNAYPGVHYILGGI